MSDIKPFLRWAGSKKKLLPQMAEYWRDEFECYIEPFAGSASFFYYLSPRKAILSDSNKDLIKVYKSIKKNAEAIYEIWSGFPICKDYYYKFREDIKTTDDPILHAALFLYLNRNCFNGLYRTNLKGEFNVPFSGVKTGSFIKREIFLEAAKKLKNTKIYSSDFEKIIFKNLSPGNFFYLDPPYAVKNKKIFRQYGPDVFGVDDMCRLLNCLKLIDGAGAHFLMSYADECDVTGSLDQWNIKKVNTFRNISGFSKFRKSAKEILISNF